MLIYNLDQRNGQSKYEYLYECLREDILNGRLAEGEKMPSKRQLAKENGISVRTVMNAYEQLQMEGYLESRERSGYYVVSDFDSPLRYQKIEIPDPTPEPEEEWMADFTANTTVYEKFPFSMWTKAMRQVLSDYHLDLMKRGEFLGSPKLRQEIAKYLYHNRSMVVSPDCIGIHMGSLKESKATVVHTSPEHHYPLGTVMSARRRQELLKWVEESEDHYIIEDDYDCEFRYNGHSIAALYGLDTSQRVIYMNTFSKTLSPGIRISYMVLPQKLLEKYVNSANFFSNTSSNLEQYTLARFLQEGYFERHVNRMRRYYRNQGETLKKVIEGTPSIPVESIAGIETGTHLLVKLHTDIADGELKQRARKKRIHLCCLSEFCVGEKAKYEHVLVLNYSGMEENKMKEVAEVLGEIFEV